MSFLKHFIPFRTLAILVKKDWKNFDNTKIRAKRKVSFLRFLWADGKEKVSEINEALKNRADEHATFDQMSIKWGIDIQTDEPERAARVNAIMAVFYLCVCGFLTISLANSIALNRYISIVSCCIGGFASLVVGLSSVWRYQIFSHRRYTPFLKWFKNGGSFGGN